MDYGFELENNPSKTVPITLPILDNDSFHVQTKTESPNLGRNGLVPMNHDLSVQKPMLLGLLATARLMVIEE